MALDILRDELHASTTPFDTIAAEVGISTSTLYSIMNGKTRWPRQKTLFGLVNYFGLVLVLTKKDNT